MTHVLPPQDAALLITHDRREALQRELQRLLAVQQEADLQGSGAPDPTDPTVTLQDRIGEIRHALAHATLVSPGADGFAQAAVGTTVDVHDGRRDCRYALTLALRADAETEPGATAVSATSPVGRALIGSAVGDTVTVCLPDGRRRELRVVRIHASA